MHERRDALLILLVILSAGWLCFAFVLVEAIPSLKSMTGETLGVHRIASLGATLLFGVLLFYDLVIADRMPNRIRSIGSGEYLERDGICLMPVTRVVSSTGEISLYYQNRHAGDAEVVVHLRPQEDACHSHRGARDIHFCFHAPPGAFGVIHQPIGVSPEVQGMPVEFRIAAAVRWPRGKGTLLMSRPGRECGTFDVDWALAYRQSAHELCGEIELRSPIRMRLTLPDHVDDTIERGEWKNEVLLVPTASSSVAHTPTR